MAGKSLGDQLDSILGGVLAQGWNDPLVPVETPPPVVAPPVATEVEYPPLPVRQPTHEAKPSALTRPRRAHVDPAAADAPGDDEEALRGVLDIGMLSDLAAGRTTPLEAAEHAGVTTGQLQASLAVALREVPPDEIAKAMGLQAAEQQLKSGAIYGAVLADLVADMAAGRLKPEVKIELAKLLAKVGRIEPKEAKDAGTGGGFILNISVGAAPAQPITIESN